MRFFLSVALLFSGVLVLPSAAHADDALWEAARTGKAVAIMRHALAPGGGDPGNFDVNDCSTQRNLSDTGREQARRIGQRFRDNGIAQATVYSSAWCRCMDTGTEMALGDVVNLPFLNSFFQDRRQRDPQNFALKAWIRDHAFDTPVIMVTHQVNITALTTIFPQSGEIIFVSRGADGKPEVLGTIKTAY